MTRSAVRSRLAPPRFALRATRGARRSPEGEDGPVPKLRDLSSLPRKLRRPLLHKARHALFEIAALERDLHLAVSVDGGFRQCLERHVVKLALDDRHRA